MFIQQLDEAMEQNRYLFGGKKTMNRLLMMPLVTVEDRFKLLLELLTFSGTFSYGKIEDPKDLEYTTEYTKCYKLLAEASMYINNASIVSSRFKDLIQYLSAEFIKEVGENADFTCIPDIYAGKVRVIQFLTKKTKISTVDTAYLFKAKSGTVYQGKNLKDLAKLTQDILLDIVEGIREDKELKMSETQYKVLNYVLDSKPALVSKFKNHRVCLIAFINWIYNPEIRNNVIVFILEELNIPHEYGLPTQAAVIAIKKAKAKKQNA